MIEGNRIRMDKPGDGTPVPAGTYGRSLGFKDGLGWEVEWETGVTTFFPNAHGDEVSTLAPEGEMRCDFCSSTDPRWEHRCHDVNAMMIGASAAGVTTAIGQNSLGSWAACEPCHRLIEAGKADKLARRSARALSRATGGMSPNMALAAVKQAHGMYWNNRVGPGFPIRREAA